jgi:hypothetical protein
MIAARIREEFGEEVAERTVGRRKAEWEAEQQRRQAGREQMEDLVAAARGSDLKASEMIEALAREALMRDPEGLGRIDSKAALEAEKVRLQRETLALKRDQLDLDRKKYEDMKQREQQAIEAAAALEDKAAGGQSISPEDIRKIREVYGLNA